MHKVCIDGQETQFSIGQNAWTYGTHSISTSVVTLH